MGAKLTVFDDTAAPKLHRGQIAITRLGLRLSLCSVSGGILRGQSWNGKDCETSHTKSREFYETGNTERGFAREELFRGTLGEPAASLAVGITDGSHCAPANCIPGRSRNGERWKWPMSSQDTG